MVPVTPKQLNMCLAPQRQILVKHTFQLHLQLNSSYSTVSNISNYFEK